LGQKKDMLMSEEFPRHLRRALNYLYDPDQLRSSLLAPLFGVADRFDTPTVLQRILTDAIASFEPGDDELPGSPAWWIYDCLFCCYVQQLSQREVADQLGVSVRHLRRKQRVALEALAERLWEQFDIQVRLDGRQRAEDSAQDAAREGPSVSQELAWLKDFSSDVPTDLHHALCAALDRARPLAARHRVRLEITSADELPYVSVHPVALNQALLSLFSVAIHREADGGVYVSAESLGHEARVCVRGTHPPSGGRSITDDDQNSLEMAHRLAGLCGGRLSLGPEEAGFNALLTLQAVEQLPVLAIDDNADTLQLLQRYTADTRYRLVGVRDAELALDRVTKLAPRAIVLDVMMPEVDGWEILARLRQHPFTCDTPIVVCTILAQEDLALSLGATAFIRKPVLRQDFLAILDQAVPTATRSR
jgi:CheY-like chemotaxis protein